MRFVMTIQMTAKASEYKKACDDVLLGRARSVKAKQVKFENGSSLAYLKALKVSKHK